MSSGYNVDTEIQHLVGFIRRLGTSNGDQIQVRFKELFEDDEVSNTLESLAGTLKAAKKKKIINYGPELLLQGASDDVIITLL